VIDRTALEIVLGVLTGWVDVGCDAVRGSAARELLRAGRVD
jgi:hypothetical protein